MMENEITVTLPSSYLSALRSLVQEKIDEHIEEIMMFESSGDRKSSQHLANENARLKEWEAVRVALGG